MISAEFLVKCILPEEHRLRHYRSEECLSSGRKEFNPFINLVPDKEGVKSRLPHLPSPVSRMCVGGEDPVEPQRSHRLLSYWVLQRQSAPGPTFQRQLPEGPPFF